MILTLITIGAIFIAAVSVLIVSTARARDGHEDAEGFHFSSEHRMLTIQRSTSVISKIGTPELAPDLHLPVSQM